MSSQRLAQEAVLSALEADAPYMALVAGVFDDEVPEGTAYPYTLIGDWTEGEHRCHDVDGHELTLMVHDFSLYEGKRECQLIREARNDVIHRTRLTLAGWSTTFLLYEWGEILVEYDDELGRNVRHQVTRYRIHTGADA